METLWLLHCVGDFVVWKYGMVMVLHRWPDYHDYPGGAWRGDSVFLTMGLTEWPAGGWILLLERSRGMDMLVVVLWICSRLPDLERTMVHARLYFTYQMFFRYSRGFFTLWVYLLLLWKMSPRNTFGATQSQVEMFSYISRYVSWKKEYELFGSYYCWTYRICDTFRLYAISCLDTICST